MPTRQFDLECDIKSHWTFFQDDLTDERVGVDHGENILCPEGLWRSEWFAMFGLMRLYSSFSLRALIT